MSTSSASRGEDPNPPERSGSRAADPDGSHERAGARDDFLDIIEEIVDGIMVVDPRGEVRFANRAAATVLGRVPQELLQLPFGLPLTGGGGFAQLDVARSDGTEAVVEMHVAPLRWRGTDARLVILHDITPRVWAERRLARSEERFALSAMGANDGLWDWERETGRVHTSARLQEMLGRQPRDRSETLGHLFALVHPEDIAGLRHEAERHIGGHTRRLLYEFRLRRRDGSWLWVMARGIAVSEGGSVRRFAGSLSDISDRKRAEESLRRLALRDPLTGLSNRALFLDHLHSAIERHRRSGDGFAVLFLDLDRFKLVNDSLGHAAGDVLLIEIGRRLEDCLRSTDTVARLGGDEFAVLLEAPEDLDTILATVRRIRQTIAVPVQVGTNVIHITASVGVARSDDLPSDPETALRYADIAMYQAKGAGRNKFQVFAATMHEQASSLLQLHSELREAAHEGLLFPRYQPIVDLADGHIVGFEALLRWRRPSGVVLDAAAFIDAAEDIEVIVPVGRDLLAEASRQLRDWRAAGFPVEVTVNVSHRQFIDADLADQVGGLIADLGLDGRALGIEITERTAMVQAEAAVHQMDRLRAMGVCILVDDFGTGYSSLAAIQRLPLTALKIDKSFVTGLDHGETPDIVAAIVAMAESLHLRVVAEGIETVAQRDRLRALGCAQGQGFLFGRAVDAAHATRLLQAEARGRG